MITKKLVLASAVASALGAAGNAQAIVQGVPGEALLVPFAVGDYGEPTGDTRSNGEIHTAVIIHTPRTVGQDTVLRSYTMPNTFDGLPSYTAPDAMTVKWYAFDERSKEILDGQFDMTPNDTYLWSPGANRLREYIGYLVFADQVAKNGDKAATFAMAGHAFMLLEESCNNLGDPDTGLCSSSTDTNLTLPVVPMSDGIDYCYTRPYDGPYPLADANPPPTQAQLDTIGECAHSTGKSNLGVDYQNNVVARFKPTAPENGVGHVSPLIAGVRMQGPFTSTQADGVGGRKDFVLVDGLFSHYDGNWTHVFWFSENDNQYPDGFYYGERIADPTAYDDDETPASCEDLYLPNEVNAFVYADDDNKIYDLVQGWVFENDNDDGTDFEDACLKATGNTCDVICGVGDTGFFGWPEDGFTQAQPGIGFINYLLPAGPTDTSTALFFQFMSNINWDGNYNDGGETPEDPIAVGSDFDVYSGGYQPMTELGKF
jgi:hypothetical protein